jgi:hypothetical protein
LVPLADLIAFFAEEAEWARVGESEAEEAELARFREWKAKEEGTR